MIDFSYVFSDVPAIVGDLLGWQFNSSLWIWWSETFSVNVSFMFGNSLITHFDYFDWLQRWMNNAAFDANRMFILCGKLVEVGAYDFANCSSMVLIFEGCTSLKHIHLKNIPISFDISASTAFEESDLVEILNNLMDMTGKTSQTLIMGATNLAKLTDAEKAIATDKNWILA